MVGLVNDSKRLDTDKCESALSFATPRTPTQPDITSFSVHREAQNDILLTPKQSKRTSTGIIKLQSSNSPVEPCSPHIFNSDHDMDSTDINQVRGVVWLYSLTISIVSSTATCTFKICKF